MPILSINCGSSTLKFALYSKGELILKGKEDLDGVQKIEGALEKLFKFDFDAVGHRLVHGGPRFIHPCVITDEVMRALKQLSPFDPDHLPDEILAIEKIKERFKGIPQVACFDTAFHAAIPPVAKYFPIPRKFWGEVHRYGFHGLSYEYLMQELHKSHPDLAKRGKLVLAHLGHGASMAAVKEGVCIDTSMGFTPTGGLMMGTRSGDLDPGVAVFLQKKGISLDEWNRLINKESGLLGVSNLSSNMQVLLEAKNKEAKEAVDMFCYHAKKYLGAYQAALGGLDAVVFTGGIGENSALIRERICSDIPVLVIKTNEEWIIAEHTAKILGKRPNG